MKLTSTLAALMLAALPAVANAAPLTMVLSNDNNVKGLKGQTFEYFAEKAKEALGDDLTVDMHHGGTLFDQNSQVVGTQLGEAHVISPSIGIYSQLVPEVAMFDLPFMLSSPEKLTEAFHDADLRALWVPQLQAKGIEPVAIWMNGPRDLGYRGDKAVLLPEDAKGLKIRVQSAPIYVAPFEAIGSNPVGVSWSETPTALEQGVIDGAEPTPNAWRGSGMWQMIDQITLTEHIYTAWIVGVNKMWWDGMTNDQRTGIQSALDAATAWNTQQADEINARDLEFFVAEGKAIHRLTPEQQVAWKDAMAPVWEEYGTQIIGEDAMARLTEIAAGE